MNNYISPNVYVMALLYGQRLFNANPSEIAFTLARQEKSGWEDLESRMRKEIFAKAREWQSSYYNCVYTGEKKVILYNTYKCACEAVTR